MNEPAKLPHTRAKDYDEDVTFPVGIKSQDGKVRHYEFEAAVSLYQQRIVQASERLLAPEAMREEISHCRLRVHQLRRSFFRRYGWEIDGGTQGPESVDFALAGEVAALLRRIFRIRGRVQARFQLLQQATSAWVWEARVPGQPPLWLEVSPDPDLEDGASVARDVDAPLRWEGSAREGPGRTTDTAPCRLLESEAWPWRIHVFCGRKVAVILSETVLAPAVGAYRANAPSLTDLDTLIQNHYFGAAYTQAAQLYRDYPRHRDICVLHAALLLWSGELEQAESVAWVASRHFADDKEVWFLLGVTRYKLLRWGQAAEALDVALRIDPSFELARFLRASLAWRTRSVRVLGALVWQRWTVPVVSASRWRSLQRPLYRFVAITWASVLVLASMAMADVPMPFLLVPVLSCMAVYHGLSTRLRAIHHDVVNYDVARVHERLWSEPR